MEKEKGSISAAPLSCLRLWLCLLLSSRDNWIDQCCHAVPNQTNALHGEGEDGKEKSEVNWVLPAESAKRTGLI